MKSMKYMNNQNSMEVLVCPFKNPTLQGHFFNSPILPLLSYYERIFEDYHLLNVMVLMNYVPKYKE